MEFYVSKAPVPFETVVLHGLKYAKVRGGYVLERGANTITGSWW